MIREGKTPQITSAIQTGIKEGMVDMDTSIKRSRRDLPAALALLESARRRLALNRS